MTRRYIITGGGGFVGKALGKALRAQGHEVVSLARNAYPDLEELGIKTERVDISSNPTVWQRVFEGASGVFHTAAKVDMWGQYDDFFQTNVIGTRNVIAACVMTGVKNLVFTSSPSVIHDGSNLRGIDESYPYPRHFDAYYPQTKARAEQEVLSANNGSTLKTVALRPHLIWGPEDSNLIPTVLERARAGRLTRIGGGDNRVDLTFIDDCIQAHLLAMKALEENRAAVFGKAYFISQGEPTNMWGWINEVLALNGLPKVRRSLSKPFAMVLANLMECIATLAQRCGITMTPLLTRFLVSEMATDHYFSIEAARRDLGFTPMYSVEEALRKTFVST